MKFEDAQQNMNLSYFGGGTGALVSGLVCSWLCCTTAFKSIKYADFIFWWHVYTPFSYVTFKSA